jgi:hypothetical protein
MPPPLFPPTPPTDTPTNAPTCTHQHLRPHQRTYTQDKLEKDYQDFFKQVTAAKDALESAWASHHTARAQFIQYNGQATDADYVDDFKLIRSRQEEVDGLSKLRDAAKLRFEAAQKRKEQLTMHKLLDLTMYDVAAEVQQKELIKQAQQLVPAHEAAEVQQKSKLSDFTYTPTGFWIEFQPQLLKLRARLHIFDLDEVWHHMLVYNSQAENQQLLNEIETHRGLWLNEPALMRLGPAETVVLEALSKYEVNISVTCDEAARGSEPYGQGVDGADGAETPVQERKGSRFQKRPAPAEAIVTAPAEAIVTAITPAKAIDPATAPAKTIVSVTPSGQPAGTIATVAAMSKQTIAKKELADAQEQAVNIGSMLEDQEAKLVQAELEVVSIKNQVRSSSRTRSPIYTLSTYYLHTIYILSTYYLHTIYILSALRPPHLHPPPTTHYLHSPHMLSTHFAD